MVSQLWAGSPKDDGSIPGRDNGLSYSPQRAGRPWGHKEPHVERVRRAKQPGFKGDISRPFSAKGKNKGHCTSSPPDAFMAYTGINYIHMCVCVCVCVFCKSRQGQRLSCLNIFVVFLRSRSIPIVSLLGQDHILPSLSPFIIASLTLWSRNFFLILAHPVYKM